MDKDARSAQKPSSDRLELGEHSHLFNPRSTPLRQNHRVTSFKKSRAVQQPIKMQDFHSNPQKREMVPRNQDAPEPNGFFDEAQNEEIFEIDSLALSFEHKGTEEAKFFPDLALAKNRLSQREEKDSDSPDCLLLSKWSRPIYIGEKLKGFLVENYFGTQAPRKCPHNCTLVLASIKPHFDGNLVKFTSTSEPLRVFSRQFLPSWSLVENRTRQVVEGLSNKRKLITEIVLNRQKNNPSPSSEKELIGLHGRKETGWVSRFLSKYPDAVSIRSNCQACSKTMALNKVRALDLLRIFPCVETCRKHLVPFNKINLGEVPWEKLVTSPIYSELFGFLLCFFIEKPSPDSPKKSIVGEFKRRPRISSFALPVDPPFRTSKEIEEDQGNHMVSAINKHTGAHNRSQSFVGKTVAWKEDITNTDDYRETANLSELFQPKYTINFCDVAEKMPRVFKRLLSKAKPTCKEFLKLKNWLSFLCVFFIVFPQELMDSINLEMYYDSFLFPFRSNTQAFPSTLLRQLTENINYAFSFLGLTHEIQASWKSLRRNLFENKSFSVQDFFSEVQVEELAAFCQEMTRGDLEDCEITVANSLLRCFPVHTGLLDIIKQCTKPKGSFFSSFSSETLPENCIGRVASLQELWKNIFLLILHYQKGEKGKGFLIRLGETALEKRNFFLAGIIRDVFKTHGKYSMEIQQEKNSMDSVQEENALKVFKVNSKERNIMKDLIEFEEKSKRRRLWCVPRVILPFRENFEIPDVMKHVQAIEELNESKKNQLKTFSSLFREAYPLFQLQFYSKTQKKNKRNIFENVKEKLIEVFGSENLMSHLEAHVSQFV